MQYVIVIYLVFRLVTFEVVHSNSSTCMGNASNTSEKKSTVFFLVNQIKIAVYIKYFFSCIDNTRYFQDDDYKF